MPPPPPFGPGGRSLSLAGEGLGESPCRRGDIYCGAHYKYFVLLPIVYIGNEFDPPKDNSLIFAIDRITTKNFKLLSVLLGQFSVKQKEVIQVICDLAWL